eukprot:1159743-Pelagomonas_calceolata.AAC.1
MQPLMYHFTVFQEQAALSFQQTLSNLNNFTPKEREGEERKNYAYQYHNAVCRKEKPVTVQLKHVIPAVQGAAEFPMYHTVLRNPLGATEGYILQGLQEKPLVRKHYCFAEA